MARRDVSAYRFYESKLLVHLHDGEGVFEVGCEALFEGDSVIVSAATGFPAIKDTVELDVLLVFYFRLPLDNQGTTLA